jgi:DNA integrity scanning protein DisA with diadenylate cyclase activity
LAKEIENKISENNNKIIFAKVDATTNKKIAKDFSVKSFPTIKYVKNGFVGDYTGARSKQRISSFISIMEGESVTEIETLSELRKLHTENVIYDTPSNIVFLLKIFVSSDEEKKSKSEIEKSFNEISEKNHGKGIFAIYKTEDKSELDADNSILDGNNQFSLSKIEIGKKEKYLKLDSKIMKLVNEGKEVEKESSENEKILNNKKNDIYNNQIESFFLNNNRPIVSELSQSNFKELSKMKKIMIVAIVSKSDIDLIKNENNNKYKNEYENNKQNNILINLDIILNKEKIINNLNNYVIGFLDLEKWKKFLEQFSVGKTSILMIDFRTENLSYAVRDLNIKENNDNIEINNNSENNNEHNDKYILNINDQLEIIFDDLIENKIEFRKTKNYFERLNDYFSQLKIRFINYYPYSYIVVAIFLIFLISFLLPSPSIKVKKNKKNN